MLRGPQSCARTHLHERPPARPPQQRHRRHRTGSKFDRRMRNTRRYQTRCMSRCTAAKCARARSSAPTDGTVRPRGPHQHTHNKCTFSTIRRRSTKFATALAPARARKTRALFPPVTLRSARTASIVNLHIALVPLFQSYSATSTLANLTQISLSLYLLSLVAPFAGET